MKSKSFVEMLRPNDVVVFVGAHPDDETLAGPVLAWAADHCRKMAVISMTKGESGWNLGEEDMTQTLAQVRTKEFNAAVRKLGGEPILLDYINGTSIAHPEGLAVKEIGKCAVPRWCGPGGRDATPEDVFERWTRQGGDPVERLARLFDEMNVTVLVALDPKTGVTDHEEHITATHAVMAAAKKFNQTSPTKITLYYIVRPPVSPGPAECVRIDDLNTREGKRYDQIAKESLHFYVSQYEAEYRHNPPVHKRKEIWLLPASAENTSSDAD